MSPDLTSTRAALEEALRAEFLSDALAHIQEAIGCLSRIEAGVEGWQPNVVTIKLQRREDGGLRVYSDDVPGLILSGIDPVKVMADVWPALEVIRPLPPPPASQPERSGVDANALYDKDAFAMDQRLERKS